MRTVGDTFRSASVAAVYLVHGTFVGSDALGILSKLESIAPSTSQAIRRWKNVLLDAAIGESGNYTHEMAKGFQDSMQREGAALIPVRRFHWSSQNNRVSDEGMTLLVDYGPPAGRLAQHHAGHAVYTRSEWLLFHAEQTAQCFY